MSERNARRVAATHGCQLSVVARDGDEYDVTDDLVPTRISVAVDQGIVIGLRGVG